MLAKQQDKLRGTKANMAPSRVTTLLLVATAFATLADAFYLPGVAPRSFESVGSTAWKTFSMTPSCLCAVCVCMRCKYVRAITLVSILSFRFAFVSSGRGNPSAGQQAGFHRNHHAIRLLLVRNPQPHNRDRGRDRAGKVVKMEKGGGKSTRNLPTTFAATHLLLPVNWQL